MTPTKKVLEEEKYIKCCLQFPPAGGSTVFVLSLLLNFGKDFQSHKWHSLSLMIEQEIVSKLGFQYTPQNNIN